MNRQGPGTKGLPEACDEIPTNTPDNTRPSSNFAAEVHEHVCAL